MPGLSAITCPTHDPAPPGQSETCTATYTTTQADVDRGSITNTGTATGTPPAGPALTRQSSVTIPATPDPAITLVKTASITELLGRRARSITYSYQVTNTGNVTLHLGRGDRPDAGPVGGHLPDHDAGPRRLGDLHRHLHHHPGRRRPGQHHQHRHRHRHPADRSAGHRADSSLTIPATQRPAITLVKTAEPHQLLRRRHADHLQLPVTNTGNVTLTAGRRDRPDVRACRRHLPDRHAGPGRVRDLHRHLHHHPGRRRPRAASPTPAPRPAPRRAGPAVTRRRRP